MNIVRVMLKNGERKDFGSMKDALEFVTPTFNISWDLQGVKLKRVVRPGHPGVKPEQIFPNADKTRFRVSAKER